VRTYYHNFVAGLATDSWGSSAGNVGCAEVSGYLPLGTLGLERPHFLFCNLLDVIYRYSTNKSGLSMLALFCVL